jgi:hypothetical protein
VRARVCVVCERVECDCGQALVSLFSRSIHIGEEGNVCTHCKMRDTGRWGGVDPVGAPIEWRSLPVLYTQGGLTPGLDRRRQTTGAPA